MKKQTTIILAVVAITAIAAVILIFTGTVTLPGDATPETAPVATAPAEGQTAAVEARPGSLSITVEGPAVVEPVRQLSVRSGIAGTVVDAAVSGDTVAAGDILVRFDGDDLRAALRQAQLNLEQARVDLQRAELALQRAQSDLEDKESLFSSGSITRTERDSARETVTAAELERASARIRLDQSALAVETATRDVDATEVRAPYAGVVLTANVGVGDVVSSGTVLMTFADVSRLRVLAEVDEFDVGTVAEGMPVRITADSLGDEEVLSTVERVSPAAEIINNISIFTISAVVRADQAPLRPGMSADLTVLVSDDTGMIVPSAAVSTVRGRSYLDVFENNEVVTKRVVAGTDDGRNIVIVEGLEEGELVILPESAALDTTGALGAALSGTTQSGGSSIIPITLPGSGGSR